MIIALACAGLPFALLQTAVVPALPTLQRELGASTAWTAWTVTGFLVVAAVSTPLLARLGDEHGRARVLLVTLGVFLGGCIGAALAWDIWSLIAFRAVQGVSGAVFPLAFAIIKEQVTPRLVGLGMGLIASIGGVGGALGLLLGGVILEYLSWRWLFGAAALVTAVAALAVRGLVSTSGSRAKARIDVLGAILLSSGLAVLLVTLTKGPDFGWASGRTLGLICAALGLLAVWVLVERHVDEPLVDVRMLVGRTVLFTNIASMVAGFGMFATFVVIPQLVETPRGLAADVAALVDYGFNGTPTTTGLLIVPASAALVLASLLAGSLGQRVPAARLFVGGMVVLGAGTALLALWHTSEWQVAAAMGLFGVGIGSVLSLAPRLITEAVRSEELAVATGMNAVLRMVGHVLGGQAAAAILASSTIAETSVPTSDAFTIVFWLSAAAALAAAGAATFMTPRRRAVFLLG